MQGLVKYRRALMKNPLLVQKPHRASGGRHLHLSHWYAVCYCNSMTEVQERLKALQEKEWTLAAIADELGLTVNAIVKWKAGDRTPTNRKSILEHLDRLLLKRRVPRQRRYQKGSRVRPV